MSLKVLVTVGTDHHPFDRVIQWVEAWSRRQPAPAVEVYMQTGTSRPPEATKSTEYLDFDDLMERIGEADAVISHGGPSTISHCLRLGVMPIVVPREHDRGEHVDDHQVAFSTKMAEDQGFEIARTEAQLDELLDQALTDPGRFRHAQTHNELESSVERFVDVIDGLLDPAAQRHGWPDRLPRRPLAAPDRTDGWRVLYVGGWGRSGSTLLDRMLGQVPKVISVGEVREIFQRGCVENRLCGCGVHFLDCSFWSAVGDRAFGGWSKVDSEDVVAAWRRVDRPWVAPALVGPRLPQAPGAGGRRLHGHPRPPLRGHRGRLRRVADRRFLEAAVLRAAPGSSAPGASAGRAPRARQPRRRVLLAEAGGAH